MAFIVEMSWGKSNELIIEGFNDDGDLVPAYTIPSDKFDPEWRFYSCSSFAWNYLIKLGKAYGWEQLGSKPAAGYEEEEDNNADYAPNSYFHKMVEGEDAKNWATALKKALKALKAGELKIEDKQNSVLIRDDMTKDEYESANSPVGKKMIREFINFLSKGPFRYIWDD